MIRQLRKNIQGPAGKVLIVLFCIPFALFGAEAFLSVALGDSNLGEVNGEPLSRYEFVRLMDALAEQVGGLGQSEELDQVVRQSALDTLVQQELLWQTGRDIGLAIPDEVLDDVVRALPELQQNGTYSPLLFGNMARDLGLTQDQLLDSLGRSLLLYRLQFALLRPFAGDHQARLQTLWTHERDLEYLSVAEEDFVPRDVPEDSVRLFYDEHLTQFMTRPEVDISVVELSTRELNKRAAARVGEEQLRVAYEAYRHNLLALAERRASHIMWQWDSDASRQEALLRAQQIHAELLAGGDFADLARQHSEDLSAEQGGDLGLSQGDVFPEQFEQVLAGLQVNEFSEPTEIDDAVHIIRLTEMREQAAQSFAKQSGQLRRQLENTQRQELQQELTERMSELAYSSPAIEGIAEEMGLPVLELDGLYSGQTEGTLAALPQVQRTAFSEDLIESGFVSEPISTQDDGILVLQIRAHRPAEQQSFAQAEERARQRLSRQIARGELRDRTQLLLQALQAGEDLRAAAQQADITAPVKSLRGINRTSALLDAEVVEEVFAMPAEAAGQFKRIATAEGEVWVRLLAARPALTDAMPAQQSQFFQQQIAQVQASEANRLLLQHLQQNADIWLKSPEEQQAASQQPF